MTLKTKIIRIIETEQYGLISSRDNSHNETEAYKANLAYYTTDKILNIYNI